MEEPTNGAGDDGAADDRNTSLDAQFTARTQTRFTLRAMFVLITVCAIATAILRVDPYLFFIFGLPLVSYSVASFVMHQWNASGFICVGVALLTSMGGAVGCLIHKELTGAFHVSDDEIGAICALAVAGGFLPMVIEYWLRCLFDGGTWILSVVRGNKG